MNIFKIIIVITMPIFAMSASTLRRVYRLEQIFEGINKKRLRIVESITFASFAIMIISVLLDVFM